MMLKSTLVRAHGHIACVPRRGTQTSTLNDERRNDMSFTRTLAGFVICLSVAGCALTSKAPNFNGLKELDGSDHLSHINMTKVAVHCAIVLPCIGDASLEGAVEDFTAEAKKDGAQRVRIVQSNETTLWWILPPISFLLTPRFTNVAGDALRENQTAAIH
jgi:hypothetical protein